MSSNVYYDNIAKYLFAYADLVRHANGLGLTDKALFSENLFAEVFQQIFGWQLDNANAVHKNQDSFDLIDSNHKICIQVTANRHYKAKYQNAVAGFKAGPYMHYNRFILLFVTKKVNSKIPRKITIQGILCECYDISTLLDNIFYQLRTPAQFAKLEAVLQQTIEPVRLAQGLASIPKELNTIPKLQHQYFLPRPAIINSIEIQLQTPEPLILQGTGGMGKTTCCRYIADKHQDNFYHKAWINVSAELPLSFVNDSELTAALSQTPASQSGEEDTNQKFFGLIGKLKALPHAKGQRSLLIVDNVNDDLLNRIESKSLFDIISLNTNWKVIITTRTLYHSLPRLPIDQLETGEARQLFRLYCQKPHADDQLDLLSEAAGFQPLTLELFARTIQQSDFISIADILKGLEEQGIRFKGQVPVEMPNYEKVETETTVFTCLSVAFDLARLREYSSITKLLGIFSIAPIDGFTLAELLAYELIDSEPEPLLLQLEKSGWITRFEKRYTMHPVIQEVLRIKLVVNIDGCRPYILKLNDEVARERKLSQTILSAARPLALLTSAFRHLYKDLDFNASNDVLLSDTALLIGDYNWENGDYTQALDYEEKSLKILIRIYGENSEKLIEAYNNIAETYTFLGNYDQSEALHLKNIRIKSDHQFPEDHIEFAKSYNNLGSLYYFMDKYDDAIASYYKALPIWRRHKESNYLCATLTNLGNAYYRLKKYSEAVNSLKEAVDIREHELNPDHPDLGKTYFSYAPSLAATGQLDSAMLYLNKALDIFRIAYPPNHPLIADVEEWINTKIYEVAEYQTGRRSP